MYLNTSTANYRIYGDVESRSKPVALICAYIHGTRSLPVLHIIQITLDLRARIMLPIIHDEGVLGSRKCATLSRGRLTWKTLTGLVAYEWRETIRRCRSGPVFIEPVTWSNTRLLLNTRLFFSSVEDAIYELINKCKCWSLIGR